MAGKQKTAAVVGEIDGKAMTKEQKTKVETALKTVVERELTPGIIGTHHWSVTHISIVFDEE